MSTEHLGELVGRWLTTGHLVDEPSVRITGTDTYRWMTGGQITTMRASRDAPGRWTFSGGADVAPTARSTETAGGGAVRSSLTVADDGTTMRANWERSGDADRWRPWMDVRSVLDAETDPAALEWPSIGASPAAEAPDELRRLDVLAGDWSCNGGRDVIRHMAANAAPEGDERCASRHMVRNVLPGRGADLPRADEPRRIIQSGCTS